VKAGIDTHVNINIFSLPFVDEVLIVFLQTIQDSIRPGQLFCVWERVQIFGVRWVVKTMHTILFCPSPPQLTVLRDVSYECVLTCLVAVTNAFVCAGAHWEQVRAGGLAVWVSRVQWVGKWMFWLKNFDSLHSTSFKLIRQKKIK
jgi:hypothetical protein